MSYTFNQKLIEQVKAGTHCIEFNREKDSLEMLQALCNRQFEGKFRYYWMSDKKDIGWLRSNIMPKDKTPIPLSNFVQPEQLERDVMAELEERLKRLEDILLSDNEPCKAEPEIVNPVRWRAENGQYYYTVVVEKGIYHIFSIEDYCNEWDDKRYNSGNYFPTKQQAEEMAVLMQFTLNNPELVKQLMTKKE